MTLKDNTKPSESSESLLVACETCGQEFYKANSRHRFCGNCSGGKSLTQQTVREFLENVGEGKENEQKTDFENLVQTIGLPESKPLVYFLWLGNELVYVGKTDNLHSRLKGHYNDKDWLGQITSITYLEMSYNWKAELLENLIIGLFNPRFNKWSMFQYIGLE